MTQSEVARMIGIAQPSLSFWVTSGLLRVEGGGVRGRACLFTGADLMRAWTIKELRDQGASLQAIRPAIHQLESLHGVQDWHAQWLFVDSAGDILWLDSARDALLRLRDSQGFVVDVAGIRKRLKARAPSLVGQGVEHLTATT